MAIKMVREPSETPNIRNIDDIIGLRYAYGNQDGYVIGKGNELSHSINGSTFTINSGRIVLQGVESDIDANGVSLSVDNVAEKRYFTVYYKVNLETNTTFIESTFDTAGYPNIDSGDDLTKISNGISNLALYHFTAQNGTIEGVEKLVKPIDYVNSEYIKIIKVNNAVNSNNATTADNAKKINNLEIKQDSNGVLKLGNEIIQKQQLIWSGNLEVNNNETELNNLPIINLSDKFIFRFKDIKIGTVKTYNCLFETKIIIAELAHVLSSGSYSGKCASYPFVINEDYICTLQIRVPNDKSNTILLDRIKGITISSTFVYTLVEIYKIIE